MKFKNKIYINYIMTFFWIIFIFIIIYIFFYFYKNKENMKNLEKVDFDIIVDLNKIKNNNNITGFGSYFSQNVYKVDYI